MEIHSPEFRNKFDLWMFSILVISALLAALFAVKNIKISPDSMRFGLISQQIISGNGFRVPIIRLEDMYIPVNGAITFLDQMPLYPLLLAVLGGVTPQSFLAGQIVNVVCLVIIAILTYLIVKRLYDNSIAALFAGVLAVTSYPLIRVTHHVWSEPLFIAFTVASIYFLVCARSSSGLQFRRNFFIASICAGASILTRNAGVALVPVFFWEVLVLFRNKRPESKSIFTIIAVAVPILTSASMFVRNYMVSGMLRGFYQPSPERSFVSAFTGTIKMIFMQFQLGEKSFMLIALLMVIFVIYYSVNANLRKDAAQYFSSGLDLILVYVLSYAALIVIAMAKQAWNYELRLVSPLVPFLFICSVTIIVLVCKTIERRGFVNLAFAGMIISLSILTLGNCYKTYLNLPGVYHKSETSHSILNTCSFNWLKENYERGAMIVTNKPFHLGFFGEYSTVALPHKRFDPNIQIPEDMKLILPKQMTKFGSRVLALFFKAEEKYEGSYIAKLFNKRETDDTFNLVYECPDSVVYILKE